MKPSLLPGVVLLSLAAVHAAPIQPRQGGIWKLISTIGDVIQTGISIYGLFNSGDNNNNNNNNNIPPPGSYPYPVYGPYSPYYPYYNYAGASYLPRPDQYTGDNSALTFISRGGGWTSTSPDLPGTLSIDNPPYSYTCYGLSPSSLVSWIQNFQSTYHSSTGSYPLIRTSPEFWSTCTGNNPTVGAYSPLWIVQPTFPSTVPAGWTNWTFWDDGISGLSTSIVATVYNGGGDGLNTLAGTGVVASPILSGKS